MVPGGLSPAVNRRRFLGATGATLATAIAGCVGGQPDDGGSPSDPPSEFTVLDAGCGTQVSEAQVSSAAGTVTVEGTIWGNDACYTARLDRVRLAGDTLTVRVVSESTAEPGQGCAECITEIDYRATVEVDATPATVEVVHDGETVRTTAL